METKGARLKKIRLEKGLTLEEVHKKTKVHLNILKAIEEDSLVSFSPVYIKGFLKIYCNLLGVDLKDYLSDYKESVVQKEAIPEKEKKPLPNIKTAAIGMNIIRAARDKIRIAVIVIAVLALAIVLFKFGKFVFLKARLLSKRTRVSEPIKVVPKQGKMAEPVKQKKAQSQQAPLAKPKLDEESVLLIRLSMHAKEDCWIQVKKDGKVIFQNILKKGRSENWEAKERIELSLGNAGAVELEINGKIIPSLGRRGQAVKNILITKDGLSTQR